jgi:hypothetical protein
MRNYHEIKSVSSIDFLLMHEPMFSMMMMIDDAIQEYSNVDENFHFDSIRTAKLLEANLYVL